MTMLTYSLCITSIGEFMKLLLVLVFIVSSAFAGLDLGTYSGVYTDSNEACELKVYGLTYDDGVKGPLNERVYVSHAGYHFEIRHPSSFSFESQTLNFDKDHLNGLKQLNYEEYVALSLTMIHSQEYHGPDSLTFRDKDGSIRSCSNVRFNK